MNATQEQQLKETHETVVELAPMIRDHHKTLYGNGQPGLKDRVTTLEAREEGGNSTKQNLIMLGMFIIAIASAVIAYMK